MITLQIYRLPHSTYANGKVKRRGFEWVPKWSRQPYWPDWLFAWLWWGALRRDGRDAAICRARQSQYAGSRKQP